VNSVPAHELTRTVLCKVEDCREVAVSARGRYAKLCDEHRRDAARDAAAARPAVGSRALTASPVSIKQAAQKLVSPAADLDKALQRRNAARSEAREAFAKFKAALDELHQVAREAVA
jgi:hypothetical protein